MSHQENTDIILVDIASYVHTYKVTSAAALHAARYCIIDALDLASGLFALDIPECTKLLGPIVPGTIVPIGVHVPGTNHILDPVQGAFNIGCMNQWLGLNDAFLEGEAIHPSDNLASVLAVAEYVSRKNHTHGKPALTMRDVADAMIKAYEIQGILSLNKTFASLHLDQAGLVKIASTAVVSHLLGSSQQETINAVSNAFIDAHPLAFPRHIQPGTRSSWAAGDAAARAVSLSLMADKGEMGYPSGVTSKPWGFEGVYFREKSDTVSLLRPLGSYVIENVRFNTTVPANNTAISNHQPLSVAKAALEEKFSSALSSKFTKHKVAEITRIALADEKTFYSVPVTEFVQLFVS